MYQVMYKSNTIQYYYSVHVEEIYQGENLNIAQFNQGLKYSSKLFLFEFFKFILFLSLVLKTVN